MEEKIILGTWSLTKLHRPKALMISTRCTFGLWRSLLRIPLKGFKSNRLVVGVLARQRLTKCGDVSMFFQVLETHIKRTVDLRGGLESISVMILDGYFEIASPFSANLDIVLRIAPLVLYLLSMWCCYVFLIYFDWELNMFSGCCANSTLELKSITTNKRKLNNKHT